MKKEVLTSLLIALLFLTGCVSKKSLEKSEETYQEIVLPSRPQSSITLSAKLVLKLPPGEEDGQVAWRLKNFASWCSLDTIGVDDFGRILVVDHPSFHRGARAQLFDSDGKLIYSLLLPAGSCIFRLSSDGYFYYCISKVETPYERVRLYDPKGKVVNEYVLRSDYNSVDIFFNKKHQLYVYLLVFLFDRGGGRLLKPNQRLVYIGSETEVEPPDKMGRLSVSAAYLGKDDYFYTLDYRFRETQRAIEVGKKVLKIGQDGQVKSRFKLAPFMKLFSVDKEGNFYFIVERDYITWSGNSAYLGDLPSPFVELWKVSQEGKPIAYYPIPNPERYFFGGGEKIAINSKGEVYFARVSSEGVEIYRYEVK